MLFIYLLQADPKFGKRVAHLRERSLDRGDEICTSALALGEVLAGVYRDKSSKEAAQIRDAVHRSGVKVLPLDGTNLDVFARIRATHRTTTADSVHLACAATYGVDLFLTNDKELLRLQVSGIKFFAGLDTGLLG